VIDIPVRVAADESLHGPEDLAERIDLGYGAVALKPAGKTLSQSVLLAAEAIRQDLACFVADSACVPALLAWNLLFAAHLPPFPGLDAVLMESNGAQNYSDWDRLIAELPASASWLSPVGGEWRLDEEFFASSGGVFEPVGHYEGLVDG
jgi:L-alanine-DL-glutamate epimerase-like enolase superfamily enzyme